MSSRGQALGFVAGVIGAAFFQLPILIGVGMLIGTIIDPPRPDIAQDAAKQEDIQFNPGQRGLPVPVLAGRRLITGPLLWLGKSELFETTVEIEYVQEGTTTVKTEERKEIHYDVDFGVILSEGVVDEAATVYRNDEDVTTKEGTEPGSRTDRTVDIWELVAGSSTETVKTQVTDGGFLDPVPWRHTAWLSYHGDIGVSPYLPTISVEAVRWSDFIDLAQKVFTAHTIVPLEVRFDWYSDLWYAWSGSNGDGINFYDRDGNETVQALPSDWSGQTLGGAWYFGWDDIIVYQKNGGNRSFAFGRKGLAAGSSEWEFVDLESIYYADTMLWSYADTTHGYLYSIHEHTSGAETVLVVQRLNVRTKELDGAVIQEVDLPILISNMQVRGLFYDAEFGYVYVSYNDQTPSDSGIFRFPWKRAETPEPDRIDSYTFSGVTSIIGVAHSGTLAMTVDKTNDRVRYYDFARDIEPDTNTESVFWTSGTNHANRGNLDNATFMTFVPETERLVILDGGTPNTDDWVAIMCEWDTENWNTLSQSAARIERWSRMGDVAGVVRNFLIDDLYGAGALESEVFDTKHGEAASGFRGRPAYDGNPNVGSPIYGPDMLVNVLVTQRRELGEVLFELITAAGLLPVDGESGLKLVSDRNARRVVARFTDNDFEHGKIRISSTDRLKKANAHTVQFKRADDRYRDDFIEDPDEYLIEQDGEFRESIEVARFVTNPAQAGRLALRRGLALTGERQIIYGEILHVGSILEEGDLIQITHDVRGTTGGRFQISEIEETEDNEFKFVAMEIFDDDYLLKDPPETQLPDLGDLGGTITNSTELEAPVRAGAYEEEGTGAVAVFWSRGENPGPVFSYTVERKLSSESAYKTLGTHSAVTRSYIVTEQIDIGETDITKDALLSESGQDIDLPAYAEIRSWDSLGDGRATKKEIVEVTADSTTLTIARGKRNTTDVLHSYFELQLVSAAGAYTARSGTKLGVTDITSSARSTGIDTLIFQTGNNELYVGNGSKFNGLLIDLATASSRDLKIVVEYAVQFNTPTTDPSNFPYWRWKRVSGLIDTTNGFTQNGYLYWQEVDDWISDSKHPVTGASISGARYWIRITRKLSDSDTPDNITEDQIKIVKAPYIVIAGDNSFLDKYQASEIGKGATYRITARTATGTTSNKERNVTASISEIKGDGLRPLAPNDGYLFVDKSEYGTANVELTDTDDLWIFWIGTTKSSEGYGQGGYGGDGFTNLYGGDSVDYDHFFVEIYARNGSNLNFLRSLTQTLAHFREKAGDSPDNGWSGGPGAFPYGLRYASSTRNSDSLSVSGGLVSYYSNLTIRVYAQKGTLKSSSYLEMTTT